MSAAEALRLASDAGVIVKADGGDLVLSAAAAPPEAVLAVLAANKADVLALLDMHRRPSVTGQPRTWTGRLVTPEEWEALPEWDRHGPNGRLWCGLCRQWQDRERALRCLDGEACQ